MYNNMQIIVLLYSTMSFMTHNKKRHYYIHITHSHNFVYTMYR